MQVENFPFRLDDNTYKTISGLIQALSDNDAFLTSISRGNVVLMFRNKTASAMDVEMSFFEEGIQLSYPMTPLAKSSEKISAWLKNLHGEIQKHVGEGNEVTPHVPWCHVAVKAFYEGRIEYYITYMVKYTSDNTVAQDTPQGALYATEPLDTKVRGRNLEPEAPGEPEPPASWL
jgi:hypothetical protein